MPISTIDKILLATDLTPRCDAAKERTQELAKKWRAKLQVLTVLSPTLLMDDDEETDRALVIETRARIRESFGVAENDIHVLIGPADEAIVSVAREVGADLIVTGSSGGELFGQTLLGGTVKSLMRTAHIPVLLVKRPVVRAYRHVVVATDLSDASRASLEVAVRLFGGHGSTSIFHAFSTPFRMFVDDASAYEAGVREGVTLEIRDALRAWSIPGAETLPVIAEWGDPAARLSALAVEQDLDVVVTGTHGRSGIMSVLLGSVAGAIIETVGCDILVVPSRGAWSA